jgi:predicted outer membrane protein
MTGRVTGWVAAALAILLSSCAHDDAETANCADFVMSPSQYTAQIRGRIGAMEEGELTFVCRAAAYGRAQLIYARMAELRSADPVVKQFAGRTGDAQQTLSRRLDQVAIQHEGITPPPGLEPAELAARDRLAQLSGEDFDRVYLHFAVEQGEAAIALFREGGGLPEPLVSQFASGALPVLEQRVRDARSLLRGSGSSS